MRVPRGVQFARRSCLLRRSVRANDQKKKKNQRYNIGLPITNSEGIFILELEFKDTVRLVLYFAPGVKTSRCNRTAEGTTVYT